jgi:hypothetical protein
LGFEGYGLQPVRTTQNDRALQLADKVDFALDFGWRSALALRYVHCFERGFSR